MKTAKAKIKTVDFRVWCQHCCIRIAPNEEHTVVDGKSYHVRCHSKLLPVTGSKELCEGRDLSQVFKATKQIWKGSCGKTDYTR